MKAIKNKIFSIYKSNKIVLLHTFVGIFIFYFVIHPLTMSMYWIEFYKGNKENLNLLNVIFEQSQHAFSFYMIDMSFVFLFIGIFTGLGSGIYYKSIINKNKLLLKQDQLINRDIEEIIQQGENQFTEFKSSVRYDYIKKNTNKDLEMVIAKSIAGFMNNNGGKLIVGIDDNGKILGLENDYKTLKHKNRDGFERKIYEIVNGFLGAEFSSNVHIYFINLNDKDICIIDILRSVSPVYLNYDEKTIFYLRTGNSTTPLKIKEAVNYIHQKKMI